MRSASQDFVGLFGQFGLAQSAQGLMILISASRKTLPVRWLAQVFADFGRYLTSRRR